MGSSSEFNDYFAMWRKSQEQLANSWMEAVRNAQEGLLVPEEKEAPAVGANNGNGSNDLFGAYRSWLTSAASSLGRETEENLEIVKDTLSRSLNGSNVYAKLYQVWIPILQAMQQGPLGIDTYRDLFNPTKYKEVLDEVFGFNLEATTQLYDQALKTMQTLNSAALDFYGPWANAAYENAKLFPQLMQGRPEVFADLYQNMFNAFNKTYGMAFRAPAVGKDRERVELYLKSLDDVSNYTAKSAQFQYELYSASLGAMESVMEKVAQKVSRGELAGFDEVFELWVAENEKSYLQISQTAEFSKMQGEMLNAGLKARQSFNKLTELNLEDFPVAVRSEMDELYKTVYELKRKVRNLERQVKAGPAEEVKA